MLRSPAARIVGDQGWSTLRVPHVTGGSTPKSGRTTGGVRLTSRGCIIDTFWYPPKADRRCERFVGSDWGRRLSGLGADHSAGGRQSWRRTWHVGCCSRSFSNERRWDLPVMGIDAAKGPFAVAPSRWTTMQPTIVHRPKPRAVKLDDAVKQESKDAAAALVGIGVTSLRCHEAAVGSRPQRVHDLDHDDQRSIRSTTKYRGELVSVRAGLGPARGRDAVALCRRHGRVAPVAVRSTRRAEDVLGLCDRDGVDAPPCLPGALAPSGRLLAVGLVVDGCRSRSPRPHHALPTKSVSRG